MPSNLRRTEGGRRPRWTVCGARRVALLLGTVFALAAVFGMPGAPARSSGISVQSATYDAMQQVDEAILSDPETRSGQTSGPWRAATIG
jgi:hypothetical protein